MNRAGAVTAVMTSPTGNMPKIRPTLLSAMPREMHSPELPSALHGPVPLGSAPLLPAGLGAAAQVLREWRRSRREPSRQDCVTEHQGTPKRVY